jgi:ribonuclease-3
MNGWNFSVTECLASALPNGCTSSGDEGKLSQRLNALVSRTTCADIAREIGLGPHIRLGKQANDDGARDSDNILGDVMEALIGACFVTQGYEAARAMVRRLWAEAVTGQTGSAKHPKSEVQEWAAMNKRKVPQYRLLDRSGPDHAARFTVELSVPGVGEAKGHGSSKQEAETAAAAAFLEVHT